MHPTLLYNGFNLERRKIFQNNPRSNLVSTVGLDWEASVSNTLTPTQQIEEARKQQKQRLRQRNFELISKRIQQETGISQQYQTINPSSGRRSQSLENSLHRRNLGSYQSRSIARPSNNSYHKYSQSQQMNGQITQENNKITLPSLNERYGAQSNFKAKSMNQADKYAQIFDPEVQSCVSSRKSFAESELQELVDKGNYIGRMLNKRLNKYLSPKNSRQSNFFDLQKELIGNH